MTLNSTLSTRESAGIKDIQASYTTVLAPTFPGGWVYWTTPATTLTAGTTYIFTSWLTTAFTQKVNGGSNGDSGATYAGGSGYNATVTTGDLIPWSVWGTHPWDFDFRVQTRTTQCP